MKRHWTIGTAGHVDHGKTTLLNILTGKDLDTHKEEKKRGITINNGYFHLKLNDLEVGVIDVPGHSDFIKNMISGASGIDLALIVVAANSGPEKQTLEHLQILSSLGITRAVTVITKSDLLEEEDRLILDELLQETLERTGFQETPRVFVSNLTLEGIDCLKETLEAELKKLPESEPQGIFKHCIDRVFSLKGHGTVVTGTVYSGSASISDEFYLSPENKSIKVRGIQRHSKPTEETVEGDRCSFNLPGLGVDDIQKGDIISNGEIHHSKLIDADLKLFEGCEIKRRWFDAVFYSGSYEAQVRISLLNCDSLTDEAPGFIQIHLPSSRPFSFGDRYVIRSSSGEYTIGGGTILDPDPLHHRRRHQIAIERLEEVQKAGLKGLINIKIAESDFVISSKNLAFRINTPEKEIMAVSEQGLSRTDVYSSKGDHFFISRPALKELKKLILKEVDDFHTVNFLSVDGITVEEITPKLSNFGNDLNEVFIKIILENLVKEGSLRKSGKGWSLSSHKTSDNEDLYKKIEIVKKWYTDLGFTVYSQGKLLEEVEPLGIDEALLGKIIPYLVKTDWLSRFEDSYTRTTILEQTKNILLTYLIDGEPLTVAAFRDLLEGNRKLCLMAFGLFEKEGLVVRVGDTRELTQKGLQTAKEIKHSQENA